MKSTADAEALVDAVIQDLQQDPVDLLSIGDAAGESVYLDHSRLSYVRTVRDVLSISRTLAAEGRPIRILEIGAFLGVVSCTLARLGFEVTALDIPEFMGNKRLAARYARFGVPTLTANLRDYALPAAPEGCTIVIMCETLEHLNFNPLPVMSEVNRVLAPGGYLYLSLPNLASLVNRCKLLIGCSIHNPISDFAAQLSRNSNMIVGIHWREYTAAELNDLVCGSGFAVENHEFFTTHRASLPARLAYLVFPRTRGNQTLVGRKTGEADAAFHFYDAVR